MVSKKDRRNIMITVCKTTGRGCDEAVTWGDDRRGEDEGVKEKDREGINVTMAGRAHKSGNRKVL